MNLYTRLHALLLLAGLGLCVYVVMHAEGPLPTHYNLAGEVDRYGSPGEAFVLWGVWLATAALMFFVGRHPELNWSYAPGLDAEELAIYRRRSSAYLPLISLLTGGLLFVVLLEMAAPVLGWDEGLSWVFWVAFGSYMAAVLGIVAYLITQSKRGATGSRPAERRV